MTVSVSDKPGGVNKAKRAPKATGARKDKVRRDVNSIRSVDTALACRLSSHEIGRVRGMSWVLSSLVLDAL